jgi:hypothetical protein
VLDELHRDVKAQPVAAVAIVRHTHVASLSW